MKGLVAAAALVVVTSLAACDSSEGQSTTSSPVLQSPVPFTMESAGFYQPNEALEARAGSNVKPLTDYMIAVREEARKTFAEAPAGPGISGAIVVAVKPGRQSRVWLVLGEDKLSPTLARDLKQRLEALPAVAVAGGPIAFSLNFSAWGGGARLQVPEDYPVAVPQEWKDAVSERGGGYLPDDALPKAWPDTAQR